MQPALAHRPSRSLFFSLPATRFAGADRRFAAAILAVTALAMLILLAVSARYQPPPPAGSASEGDMATYARIVEQLHAGANYYDAARAELTAGGYGTTSVFNWRMPTLAWIESLFPSLAWASVLLGLGAIATTLAAAKFVRDTADTTTAAFSILALLASLFACATPAAAMFGEIPAGILILASISVYGLRRPGIGLALGLAALFVRELAAPYVLVCIYLAWRDGRKRELAAWIVGLAAFAAFYAWHASMVMAHVTATDRSYADGWIQFGGLHFLLPAAHFNGIFIAMPLWVTAILTPLCLLGLAAWPASRRAALTMTIFLVAFAVVGKPFNDYWGAIFTPVMMLGLAFVPAALRDLATAPASPSPPPRAA